MDKPHITLIFPDSSFLLDQKMFPPLGILYLAGYLKEKGLKVQCLDIALGHTLDMVESDIVGVSFTTPQRDSAFKIASRLKNKVLIAGGPHPTHMEQECLDNGFDHVVKGYGEHKLYNILINEYKLPMEEIKTEPRATDLPYPDRDALPIHEYVQYIDGRLSTPILTARGCNNSCSFCSKISRKLKLQTAERTINEMHHITETYGFTAFTIYDDSFTISKKRLAKIVDGIKDDDYRFRCFCRSDLLSDKVCELLACMGMDTVGIGIESGSDDILKMNMKRATRDDNTEAIERLHKHGIKAKAFLIAGLPGETHETIWRTMEWIETAKPDDIAMSVFQPLPGSHIFNNPAKWNINFSYNGQPLWYRGKPDEYISNVRTEMLSTDQIVAYRDFIEKKYKPQELLK